ncbi:ParB-like chromosome segregation protein Spo0J [Pantoea ananatis]|nr:ParB-like chromosome segregation protein Spo0J [Pantoea ananatis]MDR6088366.1 ParB-like chromosome segregation protein Spo0J [Pantoea ananatis]
MTNLSQVYKGKDEKGTNITTRKTYLLSVDELYVEPGYNVREIDQTHVEEFRDAFIAGEHVPPLAVQVTEHGIKVIDGHHRYFGAKLAQEAGHELRLECKDFVGSEADRIAFMVTSSQGRALEPLERAAAYQRLRNQGWEPSEIAKKVKRSVADVDHHLTLLTAGDELIGMVKNGEVGATTAVAMVREHGVKAGTVAKTQLEKAKASGKKKLTRSAAIANPAQLREKLRKEHAAWSEETFGAVGPVGPLKHLSKEALEAAEAVDDLSEWADLQFLLWDAQRRAGITDEELNAAMELKLSVNKARKWPEPKDGEAREHIREGE